MTDLFRRARPFLFLLLFVAFFVTSVRLVEGATPVDYVLWLVTVALLMLVLQPMDTYDPED